MAPLTTTQLFIIEVFTEAFFYGELFLFQSTMELPLTSRAGLHWAVFLVFLGIWT
jgi:hypothetical protein